MILKYQVVFSCLLPFEVQFVWCALIWVATVCVVFSKSCSELPQAPCQQLPTPHHQKLSQFPCWCQHSSPSSISSLPMHFYNRHHRYTLCVVHSLYRQGLMSATTNTSSSDIITILKLALTFLSSSNIIICNSFSQLLFSLSALSEGCQGMKVVKGKVICLICRHWEF